MMSDEELAELVEDIKERGQLQPIILDGQGRILDGRNRWAACQIAGTEPVTEVYGGDDPDGYALAVNIARRELRPSQKHMIREMARRVTGKSKKEISFSGNERDGLSDSATVLDHAPDLARTVADGHLPLYKAVEIARENKQRARVEAGNRERLRTDAPDLLALVDDDQLSLDDAVAALDAREQKAREEAEAAKAEEDRQAKAERAERRTATEALCRLLHALSRSGGAELAAKYDPDEELDGLGLTPEIIREAATAMTEIAEVLL
jgi:ParB-like chromosome segregation protein Spo0J